LIAACVSSICGRVLAVVEQGMVALIGLIVGACCRNARAVVAVCLLAAVGAGLYTAQHFGIDTNNEKLISPELDWRKREARYDSLFPQRNNMILVVIDGATPELALRGQALLARSLAAQAKIFPSVRQAGGGPFFLKNGLLFLSEADVKSTTQQLIAAQPFLGGLAADPSLRGVMDSLATALQGVAHGQAKLEQIDRPMKAIAGTLGTVADGRQAFLSWQSLVGAGGNGPPRTRSFIEVQPALHFEALSPGAAASDQIRKMARDLELTPDHGVRVRLTGPIALQDEEFATLAERAGLMGFLMIAAVTLTLWLAVNSFRIIFCILATLVTGLVLTMGLGLFAVGVFNIISIAFVALFVGLGVDFGIQFSVRYRAERHGGKTLDGALVGAGRGVGTPLALAAAATAAGFFSFLPTNYAGVAELGLIAGIGMIVAFVLAITMLPALIKLMHPPGERSEIGFSGMAGLDAFLLQRRRQVVLGFFAAGLIALALIPKVSFDFDPLDLRSRKVESVSTLFDLAKDPDTSPNTIDVLAPSLEDANRLADKLSAAPGIGRTLTLRSFIPEDQEAKLAAIHDASFLMDAALNPFVQKPPPTDADVVSSFRSTAKALRDAANGATTPAANDANRLASVLEKLAQGDREARTRADIALIPGLKGMLDELRASMQASPVTLQSMPPDLVRDWMAPNGAARIQVFPKENRSGNEAMKKFSAAVLAVTPVATGAPISILESGNTIMGAFLKAGILAFIAITALLIIALRSLRDVVLTIAPLLLSALLTLATCVLIGLQLNFANVIALPLLLGIGVAFDIYFVEAWRGGARNLLQSALTRAVVFSALTTASGFGTLWVSSHPGTASMGELLMISLGWTLVTTLFFLPALLGPPRGKLR
jgi:hopanoid biosynthesis associated RND transporter like protein HpnN